MSELTGPTSEDRTTVVGRTGSGKTQFSCDLLATRNWTEMPWIVADYKREKLFLEIQRVLGPKWSREMKVTDKVPDKPGIYFVRPMPGTDDDAMEALMMRIWEHGRCGFYIDEGFMLPQRLPKYKAFTFLLTQGRSLEIPMIMLYQKPNWMNTFAKGQADFFAVFELNNKDDEEIIMKYVRPAVVKGRKITPNDGLPKYHCLWYEVGEGRSTVLRPARKRTEIMNAFAARVAVPARQQRTGVI